MSLPVWTARTAADAKLYWDSRGAQYRALVAALLAPIAPFRSLLEVGCHACANLWAIRQQYPHVQLYGIDPSEALLQEARALWTDDAVSRMPSAQAQAFRAGRMPENLGLELLMGHAPECMEGFGEVLALTGATVDIVLSVYTLAYLSEPDASETLVRMCDLAEKAVVICEPMTTAAPHEVQEPGRLVALARNYESWFQQHRPDWVVSLRPFPGPQRLNGFLIARKP